MKFILLAGALTITGLSLGSRIPLMVGRLIGYELAKDQAETHAEMQAAIAAGRKGEPR